MGVSDMARACQLCGGKFGKGTMASACLSVWEKAVLQLLSWCQTLQFLPVCYWCLSSCYSSAGAQREWVWASLCADSLRGMASDSISFFHWLSPHWVSQPEVMGTYLPGIKTLSWDTWGWTGTLHSWDIPPEFLSSICGCRTTPFCISVPPTSLDVCSLFNSIVVRLPFNLIFDGWVIVVLYFSCNFHVVVWGGKPCLPMPTSWLGLNMQF